MPAVRHCEKVVHSEPRRPGPYVVEPALAVWMPRRNVGPAMQRNPSPNGACVWFGPANRRVDVVEGRKGLEADRIELIPD